MKEKNFEGAKNIIDLAISGINISLEKVMSKGACVLYTTVSDIRLLPLIQGGELNEYGEVTEFSSFINKNEKEMEFINCICDYFYNKIMNTIDLLKNKYKDKIEVFDLYKNFGSLVDEYSKLYRKTFNREVNTLNNYGVDKLIYDNKNKIYTNHNTTIKKIENVNLDDFFYIDNVHPTRYVHQFMGIKIFNKICELWLNGKDQIKEELNIIRN
ncbi:hypothetical protein SLITO_v1c04150 [Spiroplasma litorale]|uniref:SGNH hydrolase-type esterase domain-containing protein n=1 Tax=Spiroplasma litorale TaxID=216942 RepID=A0A0K1W1L9_9MOLU|nr:hypothetical protein SLITO_v1c04150 [Spiroplasma litorale]